MSHLTVDLDPLESAVASFTLPSRDLTHDRYVAFCAANRDLRIERAASGEIIVMAPAHSFTSAQNTQIVFQLVQWAMRDGTGVAFSADAGFDLPNGANRGPDASWVRKSRLEALGADKLDEFYPLCPDFVIELRSQSDRLKTLKEKMLEYIENGARLGWLVDPKSRRVHVYRPGADEEVLEDPAFVSADPELPGFRLELAPVWKPW